jgi:uncharacterized protein
MFELTAEKAANKHIYCGPSRNVSLFARRFHDALEEARMSDRRAQDPADLANDLGDNEPNESHSASPRFAEVVQRRIARRDVLRGGLAAAISGVIGQGALRGVARAETGTRASLLGFTPVPVSRTDTVVVPEGYRHQVLLPWGEPITGTWPAFSPNNTAAEQAMQMGMHHDGMHFFPIEGVSPYRGSSEDGLLVMNHEYIEPRLLHPVAAGQPLGATQVPVREDGLREDEQVRKEQHAHGVSVVRIRKQADGSWQPVRDARNRRVTALTPMHITGPLRGHASMVTPYSPDGTATRGTLNNCAHGVTPWNTYLACEENWWFYFSRNDDNPPASISRYSVGRLNMWRWNLAASGDDAYSRFDSSPSGTSATEDFRNEPHCFGWVVEIDPFDPDAVPVKRTHLGRFSHEGAIFAPEREGEPVVVYSGDDAVNSYIYKFVSARPYHAADADGSLLDEGTLYAARFDEDGSGEWLALAPGRNGLTAASGFPDIASILLNARGAADVAGATPMDRPEWGAVDRNDGTVYFTLTNNSRRSTPNAANPRINNVYGHIVRWNESGGDAAATRFRWELFALGGDTEHGRDRDGNPLTEDNMFGSPDGLWVDPDGRVWIQTDMADTSTIDGPDAALGNNMMLAADPESGEIRRFLTGPIGQEITGVVTTPDQRTMFINVQHPGAGATAPPAFARGEHASHWPEGGDAIPRSATVVITRNDGDKIGT